MSKVFVGFAVVVLIFVALKIEENRRENQLLIHRLSCVKEQDNTLNFEKIFEPEKSFEVEKSFDLEKCAKEIRERHGVK